MAETFVMAAASVTETSTTTVLSPGASAVGLVRSLNVCNVHTANTAAVEVTVATGGTEYTLAVYTQVTCQQSLQVLSQPLVLNVGDSVRLTCDPVDQVDAIASYLKIT